MTVYRLVSAQQKRYNKYSETTPAVTTLQNLSHDDTHNRPTQYEIVVVILNPNLHRSQRVVA